MATNLAIDQELLGEALKISGMRTIPVSNSGGPEKWPDFYERAVALFGKYPKTSVCESLTKTREERF